MTTMLTPRLGRGALAGRRRFARSRQALDDLLDGSRDDYRFRWGFRRRLRRL